jgi:hypothetical protein
MAFKYGYTDGVIYKLARDYQSQYCSMILNGHRYTQVRISEDIFRYLDTTGQGKKHRIYWLGKGKGVSILAVRNEANEILAEKMTSERFALLFLIIPTALAFITYMVTWLPILGIGWYLIGGEPKFNQTNTPAILAGLAVAGWSIKNALFVKNSMKNLESFPPGQIEYFGKREFGLSTTS